MANVTIYEHFELPDANGDLMYPADVKTTIASTATHTLRDDAKYVVICADADCRVSFDGAAAVASAMPLLSAVPNNFKLLPGSNRTLKFL